MNLATITDLLYHPVSVNHVELGVLLDVRVGEAEIAIWYLAKNGVCCDILQASELSMVECSARKMEATHLVECLVTLVGRAASAARGPERCHIERSFLGMVVAVMPQIMKVNEIANEALEIAVSEFFL